MIKIIKYPNSGKFICGICGCEFIASLDECRDIEFLPDYHNKYKDKIGATCNCPICKNVCTTTINKYD